GERTGRVRRRTWLRGTGCLSTACLSLLLFPTASLAAGERCEVAPIEVVAASPEERRFACSAAGDAIQLLGRCGISLRRPLHVQIMSEVRHPFSGTIFGLFDTKQERVLVTQQAQIPNLIKDTPYAKLPLRRT